MVWNVALAKQQHAKWLPQHHAALVGAMRDIGVDAVHEAQATKAVKNRTNALRSGWAYRVKPAPNRITTTLRNPVLHAYFQEIGTGIFGPLKRRIYPRVARFLRWVNPDTGQVHFARSVKGVKPKWIGKHSAFEAWGFGKARLKQATSKVAARF